MKRVQYRGYARIMAGAAAAVLVATGCLLLARRPPVPPVSPAPSAAVSLAKRQSPGPFAACERRVENHTERHVLRLVVVGASITAGVGPGSPGRSWAVVLARMLGADAVVSGVPGAGYVRAGAWRQGPVAAELARVDLRAIRPGLVIVQAGHDDIGEPATLERSQVTRAIALIHAGAPGARIALITVFGGHGGNRSAAARTDRAITSAAAAAHRRVIILDPLASGWAYQRVSDGLHPTAAGDVTIARDVAAGLRAQGVPPSPVTGRNRSPVICASMETTRQA